jgi:BirA family biotin operon repressor/biotin-[acetyl-CoA-carboxylase] ligase
MSVASQPGEGSSIPSARIAIKWPNDIMLDDAKVCGILIESPGGRTVTSDRVVIGIGINVNNSWLQAPPDAGPNGIALCDATSTRHSLQTVLTKTLNAIHDRMRQLSAGDPQLTQAWQDLCWLSQRRVEATANGKRIDGVCRGIADDGTLAIETPLGIHYIHSGSVRFL